MASRTRLGCRPPRAGAGRRGRRPLPPSHPHPTWPRTYLPIHEAPTLAPTPDGPDAARCAMYPRRPRRVASERPNHRTHRTAQAPTPNTQKIQTLQFSVFSVPPHVASVCSVVYPPLPLHPSPSALTLVGARVPRARTASRTRLGCRSPRAGAGRRGRRPLPTSHPHPTTVPSAPHPARPHGIPHAARLSSTPRSFIRPFPPSNIPAFLLL